MKFINRIIFCAATVAAGCAAGCASAPKSNPLAFTEQALLMTDLVKANAFEKGSAAERAAIQQFKTFNSDYSAANITNNLKKVYADGVYFRDPFKEIHSEPELEDYLLRTSKAVAEFSMDWRDVAEHDGDYYFRWIMSVKLKRDGKNQPPNLTTGISHVRFGPDGTVIFHQDYFDAGAFLYEKIPVLGSEIRFIKKRI